MISMLTHQSAFQQKQRSAWLGKVHETSAHISSTFLQLLTSVEAAKCNLATATGTAGVLGSLSGCAPREPSITQPCTILEPAPLC